MGTAREPAELLHIRVTWLAGVHKLTPPLTKVLFLHASGY
jgi:hypothetical protein